MEVIWVGKLSPQKKLIIFSNIYQTIQISKILMNLSNYIIIKSKNNKIMRRNYKIEKL
jgi:hypothetical protein